MQTTSLSCAVLCALVAGFPAAASAQVVGYGHFGSYRSGFGLGVGYSSGSTFVVNSGLTAGVIGPGILPGGCYGPGCGYGNGGYFGGGCFGGYPQVVINGPLYPYAANGIWGPYSNYGPLVLPGNQLFGPAALPQGAFLPAQLAPAVRPAVAQVQQPQQPQQPPRARARESNDETMKRALRFVDYGDRLFGEQKFLEAYTRYQSATNAAPDLADAYFRMGFALAAMGRRERAAEVFQRGLALNPRWSESPFRLDDIYQDNGVAKKAHLDALAAASEREPEKFEAAFLLGVMLYFDGQGERSRQYLQRAHAVLDAARREAAERAADGPAPAAGAGEAGPNAAVPNGAPQAAPHLRGPHAPPAVKPAPAQPAGEVLEI